MATISPQYAFSYFNSLGYPAESSAAIVGNLFGESGLNTAAIGDNGAAIGIAQWHAPRQSAFANLFGNSLSNSTPDQQLQFVGHELATTYKSTGQVLMGGGSLADMTKAVMSGYERPANMSSFGSRLGAASSVLNTALGKGNDLLGKATSALEAAAPMVANAIIPGSGEVLGALGIGGSQKSWLQQLEDWIANSHFWQRIALGVLALIFLGGAIFLLGNKVIQKG